MNGKSIFAALLLASPALYAADPSVLALFERVPAPPASSAAATGWVAGAMEQPASDELASQRRQVEALMRPQASASGGAMPSDYQRAAADPAYAAQLQARLQAMTPQQQMQEAMRYSAAYSAGAQQEVVRMSQDPAAVRAAIEAHQALPPAEYSAMTRIQSIRDRVQDQESVIGRTFVRELQCGDGEGGCSAAQAEHDRRAARAAWDRILSEYDRGLTDIGREFVNWKASRAKLMAEGERRLAATHYGADSNSDTNRQQLAMYHNTLLGEIELLLRTSTETAQWAAARRADRRVAFHAID